MGFGLGLLLGTLNVFLRRHLVQFTPGPVPGAGIMDKVPVVYVAGIAS